MTSSVQLFDRFLTFHCSKMGTAKLCFKYRTEDKLTFRDFLKNTLPHCMNNNYVTLRGVGGWVWRNVTKRDRVGGWVKNDHFRRDVIMQWPHIWKSLQQKLKFRLVWKKIIESRVVLTRLFFHRTVLNLRQLLIWMQQFCHCKWTISGCSRNPETTIKNLTILYRIRWMYVTLK